MSRATRLATIAVAAALAGAPGAAHAACSTPPDRFRVDGATVADRETGLLWQRCSLGLEAGGAACTGEIARLTLSEASEAATRADDGWRLPNADEMMSLLDPGCGSPAIDARVFPDVPIDPSGEGSLYWTSTEAGFEEMRITVDFRHAFPDMHSPGLAYHVRLVKDGRKG